MWGAGVVRLEREVRKAGGRGGGPWKAVGFLPQDSGGEYGTGFLPR